MRHFNFLTLTLFIILSTYSLSAQTPQNRSCATAEIMAEHIKQNPDLIDNIEAIEGHTQRFLNHLQLQTRNSTITIPVVLHIVYRSSNSIENISDKQILSQLEILNNDYRHLNNDRANTPSVFRPFAADCGIEFKLAQRTPDGKATNGIMRYASTRRTPWGKNDEVKMADKGGITPWDATKYLNIYVCAIGSGILGYSTMPGIANNLDGVVIDYRYFGNQGTAVAPFNGGRTVTHEVGHWLNLRHTWGDTECGDDSVSDTPVQEGPNYGCVSFPHKSCGNQQSGDMFMNFMDYTDDACMNMFTAGQKRRIEALFSTGGARESFLKSDALIPPSTMCLAPNNIAIKSVSSKTVTIQWANATSVNLEYRMSNTTNWITLNVKNTDNLNLTGLQPNTSYEYRLQSLCTELSSDYSSILTFKTLPEVGGACEDLYEPNNSFLTAKLIENTTTINTVISSKTDNDYFVFKHNETDKDIKIALTNLPYDYDVRLYNANHQLVASSSRSNTVDEQIFYANAPEGYYYIRVYPYSGFTEAQCYTLSVEILSKGNARENTDNNNLNVEKPVQNVRIFPNPATEYAHVELETAYEGDASIEVLDLNGRKVLQNTQTISKDITNFSLDIHGLNPGMYILIARCGTKIYNQKLIVQHNY